MPAIVDDRTQQAILNDLFRKSGKGVMLTGGIQSIQDLPGLLETIRGFNEFSGDNDPWKEHDFGRLVWNGDKVFWKIDYYDASMQYWADPLTKECHRVMTVMLAEEY